MIARHSVKIIVIIVSLVIWGSLWQSGNLDRYENLTMDARFKVRGPLESSQKVVYVNRDSYATYTLGQEFFPRDMCAYVGDAALSIGGAKSVLYDFVFSEYTFSTAMLDQSVLRDQMEVFRSLCQNYPHQVVFACNYGDRLMRWLWPLEMDWRPLDLIWDTSAEGVIPLPEIPQYPIWFPITNDDGEGIPSWGKIGMINVAVGGRVDAKPRRLPVAVSLDNKLMAKWAADQIASYERLDSGEKPEITVVEEGEKETRTVHLDEAEIKVVASGEQHIFTIGLSALLGNPAEWTMEQKPDSIKLENSLKGRIIEVPVNERQEMEINWYSKWLTFTPETAVEETYLHDPYNPMISMVTILRKYFAYHEAVSAQDTAQQAELETWFQGIFKDRVVLVGPTDPLLQDVGPTPFDDENVPRVSVHGNVIKMLSDGRFLKRLEDWQNWLIFICLTILVGLLVARGDSHIWRFKVVGLLAIIGYLAVGFTLFAQFDYILPIFAPVSSATSTGIFLLGWQVIQEEKQKRRIRGMFGTYLSPQLVNQMVNAKEAPRLGGTSQNITCFFSDIESFSQLSTVIEPSQLVEVMNTYLNAMTTIIESEGGTLDKYIGDAIIVIFGAPISFPDHAYRACRSAALIQAEQIRLRDVFQKDKSLPKIASRMRTRIGLNTGEAVVGNMGSSKRFNYTMMGDSVNLGARCESGAKYYGVYTFITKATMEAADKKGEEFLFRYIDRVVVTGRFTAEDMYELVDTIGASTENDFECVRRYGQGLTAYFNRQWEEAYIEFEAASRLERYQLDPEAGIHVNPSELMMIRVKEYQSNPPSEDWDGSHWMSDK